MKRIAILALCILLSACGGSGGGQGTSVAGEGNNVQTNQSQEAGK